MRVTAGLPGLVVSTVLVSPIAAQELARRITSNLTLDLPPGYAAMSLKVRSGNPVRNPLVVEGLDHPVEERGRFSGSHDVMQPGIWRDDACQKR